MREDKVVQFVCFETTLDKEQFVVQWEQFTKPVNGRYTVILQQSEKKKLFRYIAQYHCAANEFEFVFTRARRSPHSSATPIRAEQVGGYSILQSERLNSVHANETKIFTFLINAQADLNIYREMCSYGKLNIYEAYYENCRYAYILEFFVKNEFVSELLFQLKQYRAAEVAIYKECILENISSAVLHLQR